MIAAHGPHAGVHLSRAGFLIVDDKPMSREMVRTALFTSRGDIGYLFWSTKTVMTIWIAVAATVAWPWLSWLYRRYSSRRPA